MKVLEEQQTWPDWWLALRASDKHTSPALAALLCAMHEDLHAMLLADDFVSEHHLPMVLAILLKLDVDDETLIAACLNHLHGRGSDVPLDEINLPRASLGMASELAKLNRFSQGKRLFLDSDSPEGLRRLLLALIDDIRVVLIILAEQLACMRALSQAPQQLAEQYATVTSHIYAPLANRLGIWQLKWELEDLAFRYLHRDTYKRIASMLDERRADREGYLQKVSQEINRLMKQAGIEAEISARPKHIYSIWRKMQRKHLDFDQLFDIRAIRLLVKSLPDCYSALGMIHSRWPHVPGEFDDYIATPKGNNYQSLHTAVVGPEGKTLEVQIRTFEMHDHAEKGVAAHWRYKEGGGEDSQLQKRINWMRKLLEGRDEKDNEGLYEEFEASVAEDRVYVLTPKGKVLDLAQGSTVLDFAYHVHTDIGHRCKGAKVNGRIVPLTTVLRTGERVEVLTQKEPSPSRDWMQAHLGYLASSKARSKVRQWFRQADREHNLNDGRDILDRECRRLAVDKITREKLPAKMGLQSMDELAIGLGQGDITAGQLARHIQDILAPSEDKFLPMFRRGSQKLEKTGKGLSVAGVGGLMTSLARCCSPVPGDEITGYITQGRGVTIHRSDCSNILKAREKESPRLIPVYWGQEKAGAYPVDIVIRAYDRKGLLKDISGVLTNQNTHVVAVKTVSDDASGEIHFHFTLKIMDFEQLSAVMSRLGAVSNVINVEREGARH